MDTSPLQKLQTAIEPLRQQIIAHPVYGKITDLDDLKIFMQHHVYAVWDFMSLLKSLQNKLTCTQVPWFPVGHADTRFLINEIVVGEEADLDLVGQRKSHFELYLDAMSQAGADLSMQTFVNSLQQNRSFETAFALAQTPAAAQQFVNFTFSRIEEGKSHVLAAIFTFGREDLIPGMFMSLVNDIHKSFPDTVANFKYYLERHIEVDGDHHSHLALQMTALLCGDDAQKWEEAKEAAVASLQARLALWDGVAAALQLQEV
ncbi:MAG: DUF3050 domain-containing protein [Sphingobacteriaceae bacterium]|nr:DUF3050 domain-containing protein [Sphingobacteriaceae bacterium]